jgi:arylsulfatase
MSGAWAQVSMTPDRYYKYQAYEGGYHVPFIVSGPGIEGGAVTDAFATVMDLYPTLLEYAGTRHPGMDFSGRTVSPIAGQSMVPFLTGQDNLVHSPDYVYGWVINGFVGLRKGDWKLLYDGSLPTDDGDAWHLYNLASEGGEYVDLKDENPEMYQEMMREYRHFVTAYNVHLNEDGTPASNGNF